MPPTKKDTTTGGPRDPTRVKRLDRKVNPEELPADWLALASLVFGVLGLMMRYKLCAWLALFASMASIANMSKQEMDIKQIFASLLFSGMGLVMNYFGVRPQEGSA